MFDGGGARIFRFVEALVLVMVGSYQAAIGTVIEGTVFFEMSEVIAQGTESLSPMFFRSFLKGF